MKWRLVNSNGKPFTLIAEKMGTSYFDNFLKGYISKNHTSELKKEIFLDQLGSFWLLF